MEDFDKGLIIALELLSTDQKDAESIIDLLNISPGFTTMLEALTNIRDNSNAIRNYLYQAEEAGHDVKVQDEKQLIDSTGTTFNLGGHLKNIKNSTGNFVNQLAIFRQFLINGGIADLSDRIKKFNEISDRVRLILQSIEEKEKSAQTIIEQVNSLSTQSNDIFQKIEEVHKKSSEVNENANAALNETNAKLAKIRETASEADQLKASVNQYQSEFDAFDKSLQKRLKLFEQFQKSNEEAQAQNTSREKEIDRVIEKSNQMLRGATNAGLAKAFYDASEKYGKDAAEAKKAFYWAIAFLVLSVIPLAAYILPIDELFQKAEVTSDGIKLGGVFARAILLLPTVWLSSFTGHRYWSLFQLHREYSFKAAIAMSVDGFKQQAPEYEQEIAATSFVGLAEKPDYSTPKHSTKSPNPILNYLIKTIQDRFGRMSGSGE
ncbi:MAG: hypothetical protein ABFR82_14255 [Nitrospirota bacterium]